MHYHTRQRQAVVNVLRQARTPLTAQAIYDCAKLVCPTIGLATVFRCLRQATAAGTIAKVELPGLAPHYALSTSKHRHFFVCRQCSELVAIDGCVTGLDNLLPAGSKMVDHEIVIFGECARCCT